MYIMLDFICIDPVEFAIMEASDNYKMIVLFPTVDPANPHPKIQSQTRY